MKMDAEKRRLIRMIRDHAPRMRAADLAAKTFEDLATIYRRLAGWEETP